MLDATIVIEGDERNILEKIVDVRERYTSVRSCIKLLYKVSAIWLKSSFSERS
jgi:hypothetical protein